MRKYRWFGVTSLVLAVGIVVGAVGSIWATNHGPEVRVAARVTEEGGVEVAIQEQLDGEWNTLRPTARYISADNERGRWYYSSSVHLTAPQADSGHMEEPEPSSDASMPGRPSTPEIVTNALSEAFAQSLVDTGAQLRAQQQATERLYCLISHGDPTDAFWRTAHIGAVYAAGLLNIDLRSIREADSADQAKAIQQCTADGAAVIITTLGDPDALRPAIKEAIAADIYVATFNAGVDVALEVGSRMHLSINEAEAGRIAGQEFNTLEVSGDVVCVIHEAANVSLGQRCDGLEEAYMGGDVVRVSIAGVDDPAATIADAITDTSGGVLVLNSSSVVPAGEAIGEADLVLGSVGGDTRAAQTFPPQYRFFVSDWPWQTAHILVLVEEDLFASQFASRFGLAIDSRVMTIRPFVLRTETIENYSKLFDHLEGEDEDSEE